jgi:methionine-rich copper-binding protein CopC
LGEGLFVSADGGSTWANYDTTDGLPSNELYVVHKFNNRIYVGTDDGVSISDDNGQTWTSVTEVPGAVVHTITEHDGKVYVTIANRVFSTADNGESWSEVTFPGITFNAPVRAIHVGNEGLVVGSDRGVLVSANKNRLFDNADNTAANQILGATTHQLTINNLSIDENGAEYFVEVSSEDCTQASDDVTLTVLDVPVVSAFTPAHQATYVAIDTGLSIEFSQTVTKGTGELKIFNYATDALVETFTADDLTINGTTVSVTPGAPLDYATQYYVTFDAGLVLDANNAGNLALTDKDSWYFQTVCEPLVLSQPEDQTGAVGGSATFSVPEVAGATYQWFRNVDGGWTTVTAGQNGYFSESSTIAVVKTGGKIYVATSEEVSISSDGGLNWSTTAAGENGFADNTAPFPINLNFVNDLHAEGNKVYVATDEGLSISVDGGASWATSVANQNGFSSSNVIYAVYADGNAIYAATPTGFSISQDGGQNWTTITHGENGFPDTRFVRSIYADGNNVYVASDAGVGISADGGQNWVTTTYGVNGFPNSGPRAVYAVGNMVYAGTSGGGLAISADGGSSWTTTTPGLNGYADDDSAGSVFAQGENVYVGTKAGLSISDNGGLTWETIKPTDEGLSPNDNVLVAFFTGNEIYIGTTAGLSILVTSEELENGVDGAADNAISGADTRELTISNLTESLDQNDYFVDVTKGSCIEQSDLATLTVSGDISDLPLQIVSSTPEDGATDFTGTTITLTFNKNVFANRGRVGIFDASNDIEVLGMGGADSRVSVNGNVVTIDMEGELPLDKQWYLLMRPNTFKDAADNNFGGIWDKEEISFSSPSSISLVSSSPENGSEGFSATTMTFTFNKPVVAGVGRISLYDLADDTEITGAGVGSSRVSINGEVVTLDLINPLPLDKEVYVNIPQGAFKDVNDLVFEGILE